MKRVFNGKKNEETIENPVIPARLVQHFLVSSVYEEGRGGGVLW